MGRLSSDKLRAALVQLPTRVLGLEQLSVFLIEKIRVGVNILFALVGADVDFGQSVHLPRIIVVVVHVVI